jgi:Protein of unknown function (DUF2442)
MDGLLVPGRLGWLKVSGLWLLFVVGGSGVKGLVDHDGYNFSLLRNIGNYSRRHGMSISPNKIAQAKSLYFDAERIHVLLSDGREISAPLERFPRLRNATDEQRQQWELIGGGVGIHWEAIDEDISVAGLLGLPND